MLRVVLMVIVVATGAASTVTVRERAMMVLRQIERVVELAIRVLVVVCVCMVIIPRGGGSRRH